MQVFLPRATFAESVATLDTKRLGKQRVEVLQIIAALLGWKLYNKAKGAAKDLPASEWRFVPQGGAWSNHSATRMWRGYEHALMEYQRACCAEWRSRGFADTCEYKTALIFNAHGVENGLMPWWWESPEQRAEINLTHQSNLVGKFPEHYRPQFPTAPVGLEYYWPVNLDGTRNVR